MFIEILANQLCTLIFPCPFCPFCPCLSLQLCNGALGSARFSLIVNGFQDGVKRVVYSCGIEGNGFGRGVMVVQAVGCFGSGA